MLPAGLRAHWPEARREGAELGARPLPIGCAEAPPPARCRQFRRAAPPRSFSLVFALCRPAGPARPMD